MKILLVHEYYRSSAPSGEDAVFVNEHNMLKDSDIEVSTHNLFNDDIDDSSIMKRIKLGVTTIWSRQGYDSMKRVLAKEKPDIVHFHNTFPLFSPSAYSACSDAGIPIVQTLHNFRMICPGALLQRDSTPCEDCIDGSLLSSIRHRCYRDSLLATAPLTGMIVFNRMFGNYAKVSRYIALTRFAASRFIAAGFNENKMTIKPNFLPFPPEISDSKSDFVVYVGRLSAEKGVRTLIRAWEQLPNIPLKVLGDGPLREEITNFCEKKSLPVTVLGSVDRDEVIKIVRQARLQIIPSEWYEGFPMVILEAFACGTPVIASRIGSLDELIDDGVTGKKFIPGDSDSLATTMSAIWSSPEIMERMGLEAWRCFKKNYTLQKNRSQLRDIYEQVIVNG